jgi:hypothetical protein
MYETNLKNNKLSPSTPPTISWTFNILKVHHNHDTFRSDQTIIQWTEINAKGYKIALILTMAQVVSRRPLAAKAQVRAQVNPCGICGGQSGTGSSSVFPCQYIIPPWLSKLISSGECVI